ncbi:MAG: 6-carboxytetrahydropterin synthase [Planctomycetota bacterium]
MQDLSRIVRFTPSARPRTAAAGGAIAGSSISGSSAGSGNGLIGVVPGSMLCGVLELEVVCRGDPDATGYLVDIGVIDRAVRDLVVPLFDGAMRAEAMGALPAEAGSLLATAARALGAVLPAPLARLTLRPSPFLSTTHETAMPDTALLSETFEFAASHRMHLAGRTDDENRRLFGKCNNPNGHGHNYRVEVSVAVGTGAEFGFADIERVVAHEIMARFDHKHLNLDCPEFRDLNPSVENIARVCHGLLAPAVAAVGAELRSVCVWETDKTSSRYPA